MKKNEELEPVEKKNEEMEPVEKKEELEPKKKLPAPQPWEKLMNSSHSS